MIFPFKEKFKTQSSKISKQTYSFGLNFPPRSLIDPSYFRKTNWLPASDRGEYCIANTVFKYWNGILAGQIHEMFKPSFSRHSKRS